MGVLTIPILKFRAWVLTERGVKTLGGKNHSALWSLPGSVVWPQLFLALSLPAQRLGEKPIASFLCKVAEVSVFKTPKVSSITLTFSISGRCKGILFLTSFGTDFGGRTETWTPVRHGPQDASPARSGCGLFPNPASVDWEGEDGKGPPGAMQGHVTLAPQLSVSSFFFFLLLPDCV